MYSNYLINGVPFRKVVITNDKFIGVSLFQGTRMEERLDDAINVLRNHAESQLGLVGQLPNNLTPHQMTQLSYAAPPQTDSHLPDPIKAERPTYNTSKLLIDDFFVTILSLNVLSYFKTPIYMQPKTHRLLKFQTDQ